jgi:hypothetical protein
VTDEKSDSRRDYGSIYEFVVHEVSLRRTLKVSHECRWRDLLRQQEA